MARFAGYKPIANIRSAKGRRILSYLDKRYPNSISGNFQQKAPYSKYGSLKMLRLVAEADGEHQRFRVRVKTAHYKVIVIRNDKVFVYITLGKHGIFTDPYPGQVAQSLNDVTVLFR